MSDSPGKNGVLDALAAFFSALLPDGSQGFAGSVSVPVGSGYAVPQPPAGIQETRELVHAHSELVRRYLAMKEDFQAQTGRGLIETCTWRSAAHQQELYQIGRRGIIGERTVTQLDGVHSRSRHNTYPSQAVDVAVDLDPGVSKHVVWDRASYAPLGPLADKHSLVWGGNWHMDDFPHLELPAGVA